MRTRYSFLGMAVGTLLFSSLFSSAVTAQQPIRWQPTLDSAKLRAAQTNRLVLIHFWAPWCGACRRMEQEVLGQPSVASALQANYVPVKINTQHFPATPRQYGVTALPAAVIITPQGQRIATLTGMIGASQYAARLSRVASDVKARGIGAYARIPGGVAPRRPAPRGPAPHGPAPDPVAQANRPPSMASSQPPLVPPPARHKPPSGNPPLGLDGYCPVQLIDDMSVNKPQWTPGDRRWGAIHRGRTYLFAGPEQQHRFLADPDRYAPVLSGSDVTAAIEQSQMVPGRREHGVLFGTRIYLFASEASLAKFRANPNSYANHALQAMQVGVILSRQRR